jgi:uncharacterized protein (UPF0276 family)
MLLGLAVQNNIGLVDKSGKPCHFVEMPMKSPRLLMSDARARGLGVSWRAGWSLMMADPTFLDSLDSVTVTSLQALAGRYKPLALIVYMGYLFDAPLPGDWAETQQAIIENVSRLNETFSVPVLLENAPIGPGDAPKWSLGPDFMQQTLSGAGCGMALNLAHVLINADHLLMTAEKYLDELPLEAVVQVRLSGVRFSSSRDALYDARDTLTERELAVLSHVLQRANPKAIVLDYGGSDPVAVAAQMTLIRKVAGLPAKSATTTNF